VVAVAALTVAIVFLVNSAKGSNKALKNPDAEDAEEADADAADVDEEEEEEEE